jgi:hypothetical protein
MSFRLLLSLPSLIQSKVSSKTPCKNAPKLCTFHSPSPYQYQYPYSQQQNNITSRYKIQYEHTSSHRPNSPETQFANRLLLVLGVKLTTLSASVSLLRSGVCGSYVFARGRVGVLSELEPLTLLRKPRDLSLRVWREGVDVESREDGHVESSLWEIGRGVESTMRIVAPRVDMEGLGVLPLDVSVIVLGIRPAA